MASRGRGCAEPPPLLYSFAAADADANAGAEAADKAGAAAGAATKAAAWAEAVAGAVASSAAEARLACRRGGLVVVVASDPKALKEILSIDHRDL